MITSAEGCAVKGDIVIQNGTKPYDGFAIMIIQQFKDFICKVTQHTEKCGKKPAPLVKQDLCHDGVGMKEYCKCLVCNSELVFQNCEWVKMELFSNGESFLGVNPS